MNNKTEAAAATSDSANPTAAAKKKKKPAESDDESSSDSEGEEDVGALPVVMAKPAGTDRKRSSVSAEVFGRYNLKEAYTPYVVPKSQE